MNNIIYFIKSSRLKLNMIIIFSWFFKIIFLSGVTLLFAIIISNLFNLYNINVFTIIMFAFIGGIIGIVIGWTKRITIFSTSKWLDDYLKNNDIISAALFCIKRKSKGIFDNLIIEKANKIIMNDIKIKWPTKEIKKYLLLCLMSGLLCFFLLYFWNPVYKRKIYNNLSLKISLENNTNEETQDNKEWFFQKEETPKDLAKFLFPENQKLTELAEDAIAKGDIETLNDLFQKEFSKFNELIKNAGTKKEKEKLKEKQEEQNKIMQLIKNKDMEKNKKFSKDQSSTMLYEDENKNNKNKPKDINKKIDEQLDDEKSQKNTQNSISNKETSEKGEDLISGTKQSDTGVNEEKRYRDELTPDKNNEKLLLTQKKDSPEFIFLLPDKNTHIPLKDIIINSQRSDESAVFRKGIPIEYEDFVRSYFMSLLQEMKNNKLNEEEEK